MTYDIDYLKLGSIAFSQKGKKPRQTIQQQKKGFIPYIDIKAFEKGIFENYTDGLGCNLCSDGDLLMVWDGSRFGLVGKAYKGAIGSTLVKIKVPHCDLNFVYYFLKSKYLIINSRPKGTGTPHVNPDLLWNFHFPILPIAEQKAIVDIVEELLSDLDNAIENFKKAQDQLKVYRQAVLQFAFNGSLTNNNLKKGELPKGWRNVKLGEVCQSVQYGSAAKSKRVGEIPVLRMGNIQGGRFDWAGLVYTDNKKEIEKYSLKKDDVLFNRTNSPELVGKTALYRGERPAIFAGYLIRINRIESLIDASYLTHYLNSHDARKYGDSVKSFGVNQSNINGTKLKTYPLPLAPIKEQRVIVAEIESRFSVCDNLEETIEGGLKQAESLRQSILKQAFEGRLTEQWRKEHKDLISGENSSEALLKKIKAEKEILVVKSKGKKKHD